MSEASRIVNNTARTSVALLEKKWTETSIKAEGGRRPGGLLPLAILTLWQGGPQIQQAGTVWEIGDFVAALWSADNELLRYGSIACMKRERLLG